MSRPVEFVKVEGLGNDFLLIDRLGPELGPQLDDLLALAPRLCDRRRGVGGDGLLVVLPAHARGSAATMVVINADGSRPQMCGNGLRCVALWLAARDGSANAQPTTLVIDTDAGPRRCTVTGTPGSEMVEVDMGPASHQDDVAFEHADGRTFARVSMGNPHAVAFVAADDEPEALARAFGPAIEQEACFPEGTNVEFARVEADGTITLWVWERGCGITAACGTGACATVAAGVARGFVAANRAIEVRLPGGALSITVPLDPAVGVRMLGPARLVFRGVWPAG